MMNRDMMTLFEYLKNILYMPDCEALDCNSVGDDCRELCEGLNVLRDYVEEQRVFAQKLVKGQWDYVNSHAENQLCWGLKSVQTEIRSMAFHLANAVEGKSLGTDISNSVHSEFCARIRKLAQDNNEKDILIAQQQAEIEKLKMKLQKK